VALAGFRYAKEPKTVLTAIIKFLYTTLKIPYLEEEIWKMNWGKVKNHKNDKRDDKS
jgi:hypothetical protein